MTLQSIAQESHPNVRKTFITKTACSVMEEEVIAREAIAALERNDAIFFGDQQHCRLPQPATLQTVAAKPCIAAPLTRLNYTLG